MQNCVVVSVPSFGDSFFILDANKALRLNVDLVSVPSFGDSFFIKARDEWVDNNCYEFPSPHSGILFLYCVVELMKS